MEGTGMNDLRDWAMTDQQDRTLSGERLAEIERRLRGRLRAHRLSRQLIARHLEDAVQKGVVECLRAQAEGTEVRDPEAFVAEAAFRRAIDEVRREARRADGAALDAMLETGRRSSASAEEVAIENLESERLQSAIESLPVEERQVLNLHYFDGLDQRRAAGRLYMSERTYRRRLRRTLSDLGARLGAPAPEPRSPRGFAIGLAAWTALGGGRPAAPTGGAGRLGSLVTWMTRMPERIASRLRGPGTRLLSSEAPEQIGAIASGPAGKVIGGCAGAAIVCALSGVVGPGVNFAGDGGVSTPKSFNHHAVLSGRAVAARPQLVEQPRPVHGGSSPEPTTGASPSRALSNPAPRRRTPPHGPTRASRQTHHEQQPTESEIAEEQFSAMSRAAAESESESSASGTEAAPSVDDQAAISQSHSEPSPAPASSAAAKPAEEQRQVEEQFRGPLAR